MPTGKKMNISIKPATINDYGRIIDIRRQVGENGSLDVYPKETSENMDLKSATEKIIGPIQGTSTFIIDNAGTAMGYLMVDEAQKGYNIKSISIAPQYQHFNLGSVAFNKVKEMTQSSGKHMFTLQCNAHNVHAQEYYHSLGGEVLDKDLGNQSTKNDQFSYIFKV